MSFHLNDRHILRVSHPSYAVDVHIYPSLPHYCCSHGSSCLRSRYYTFDNYIIYLHTKKVAASLDGCNALYDNEPIDSLPQPAPPHCGHSRAIAHDAHLMHLFLPLIAPSHTLPWQLLPLPPFSYICRHCFAAPADLNDGTLDAGGCPNCVLVRCCGVGRCARVLP